MKTNAKIIPFSRVREWRAKQKGMSLVLTNGKYNIFHVGHLQYLQQAKELGSHLMVGINSDSSFLKIKNPSYLTPQNERAAIIAGLECVDFVVIFSTRDACGLIKSCRPTTYVKGGDYTLDTIDQKERKLLQKMGCQIKLLTHIPNRSSSLILEAMGKLYLQSHLKTHRMDSVILDRV